MVDMGDDAEVSDVALLHSISIVAYSKANLKEDKKEPPSVRAGRLPLTSKDKSYLKALFLSSKDPKDGANESDKPSHPT